MTVGTRIEDRGSRDRGGSASHLRVIYLPGGRTKKNQSPLGCEDPKFVSELHERVKFMACVPVCLDLLMIAVKEK